MNRPLELVRAGCPLQLTDYPGSIRVAVDLTHIRPGGENGGVKPFIFEYLRELGRREGATFTFVFLTSAHSHVEVRQLARDWDLLVCVRPTEADDDQGIENWRAGEWLASDAPLDLLLQLKVDVLYAPLGAADYACPGVPVIGTVVDLLHRDYPHTLSSQDIALRERYFADLTTRVDRFQCISHFTAARLRFHYGVESSRVFCTHIVVQQRFEASSGTSPVPANRSYFLFPANAWVHKNHYTLLVAYRHYYQAAGTTAWDLVLTGHDSQQMRSVLAAADSLGVGHMVRYFGHLPESDFSALWRHASALVFPSLHEGFGIPLLEAMHFGVPVLCSAEGSLPEVGGDAVLYADARKPVEWAECLLRLAQDAGFREKLVAMGRERLAQFKIAAEIEEFANQLKTLAREPGGVTWHRGVHSDGWMERLAVFALPAQISVARVKVQIAPLPAERRLRAYQGTLPLGGWTIPAGVEFEFFLTLQDGKLPLVLECPDASNLNPSDHRQHGVIVGGIEVHSGKAVTRLR